MQLITCDDVLDFVPISFFQICLVLASGFGYFAYVVLLYVPIMAQAQIMFCTGATTNIYSLLFFIGSTMSILGRFIAGYMGDKFGRHITIILFSSISLVFSSCMSLSSNIYVLIVLRSIASIGLGGLPELIYCYVLEVVSRLYRSSMTSIITICGICGMMSISLLTWKTLISNLISWKIFNIICNVPMLIFLATRVISFYETPRYLVLKGDNERAWIIIKNLMGNNQFWLKELSIPGKYKLIANVTSCDIACINKKSFKDKIKLTFHHEYRKEAIIVCILWFLLSFGYWGVAVFLPQYYNLLGYDGYKMFFINMSLQMPVFLLSLINMDGDKCYQGRLSTLLTYSLFSTFSLVLLAVFAHAKPTTAFYVAPLIFAGNPSLWNALYIYTPEIFPTSSRVTSSLLVSLSHLFPPIWAYFVGSIIYKYTEKYIWLYPSVWACVYGSLSFFILFLKQETSRKRLIDELITIIGYQDDIK